LEQTLVTAVIEKRPTSESAGSILLRAAIRKTEERIKLKEQYRKRALKAAVTRRANAELRLAAEAMRKIQLSERALKGWETRRARETAAKIAKELKVIKNAMLWAEAKVKTGKPRCCCNERGCMIGPFTGQIDYD
jgi:hypothetical protein